MVVKTEPKDTFMSTAAAPKPKVDNAAKGKALKEISDHRKAIAWQVHRWPLEKRLVQEKTRIHLPKSYLCKAGEDVKALWPGDDISQVVHHHYMHALSEDDQGKLSARNCANFVEDDGVTKRRCAVSFSYVGCSE